MIELKVKKSALNKYSDMGLRADLVCFWGRYPHAKFTLGVVVGALGDTGRADVEEALESMVTDDIIEKNTWRGLPFYSLTNDIRKREMILRQTAEQRSKRFFMRPIRRG